jgi:ribosomal protein S3
VIKEVKKAAVDDDTTASSIAEEALTDWLMRRAAKSA